MSSKPFDATKDLVETRPLDWVAFLGLPGTAAEVIDADLATITTEADRVIAIRAPQPELLHIEFQSSHDARLAERLLRYNVLLRYRHGVSVRSVVFLLRREADGADLSGPFRYEDTAGQSYLEFRYRAVRVWEQDADALLTGGGLATLPLAPLAAPARDALPDILRRMRERLERDAPTPEAERRVWTATYILLGLSHPAAFISELMRGVQQMRESSTYQAILAEGRAEGIAEGETQGAIREVRKNVLRMGGKRFGAPPASVSQAVEAISDLARLESLLDRVLEVESWEELLA
jgi:predicted transposase YdaD